MRAMAAPVVPKPMPTVLKEIVHGSEVLQFVSASHAIKPSGEIDEMLFPSPTSTMLQSLLERPAVDGCIPDEEYIYDYVGIPFRETLDEAVGTAERVFEGVVDGREYGFHGGEPGQLLRVSEVKALRGDMADVEALFVFVPVGRFEVDGKVICKTDRRYASPPAIGDRVIVFQLPGMLNGQFVELIDDAGLVTVRRNGALSLPTKFESNESAMTPEQLRSRIRNPRLLQKD